MGESIVNFAKHRIKKEYKLAFISTFLIGLLFHIYKFTNYLPNHDSMYNFYSDQNTLGSGRWFLSIACGFSSYFDLPWINGLFSLIFISLTTVVVVNIFDIKNTIVILLTSGIMVSFPSTTEILCFEFTADGFFLSMLLSALAVYVLKLGNNKIINIVISSLLVCFSCGIYQAYVSFTMVLFLCYLVQNLIKKDLPIKQYLRFIVNQVIAIGVGLALYYVIWKICMSVQGVTATDYQGINEVGIINFSSIINAIKKICVALVKFVLEKNVLKNGFSLFAILNIIFIILGVVILITAFIKSKVYKNKAKILLIVLSIIFLPFSIYIWYFTSPSVVYALRMEQSISLLFIFIIVICNEYINPKLSTLFAILPLIMIINLGVQANIAYYYLNFEYENSYYEAIKISDSLDEILSNDVSVTKVAIVGHREKETALEISEQTNVAFMYTNMIEKSLLFDSFHTEAFLKNILYCNYEFADTDTKNEICKTDKFKEMALWSDSHTVEIINDIAVIKLGEMN